jgi:hypothetical protein
VQDVTLPTPSSTHYTNLRHLHPTIQPTTCLLQPSPRARLPHTNGPRIDGNGKADNAFIHTWNTCNIIPTPHIKR